MVLLRTWRKDEDGTYIVLYQSTKHRAVREGSGTAGGGSRWSWFKPVRAQVRGGGAGAGRGVVERVGILSMHMLLGPYPACCRREGVC
jgi:hypothetical protein